MYPVIQDRYHRDHRGHRRCISRYSRCPVVACGTRHRPNGRRSV